MPRDESYSIGEVCMMVEGLTPKMVRYWHEEGFLGSVIVQTMGRRLIYRYTRQQVELIKRIKQHVDQGWQLRTAVEKARREMKNK